MDANNNDIRESGGNCIFSTYFVQHCSDHQLVKSEPHAWTSFMICKNKKAMGKLESVRKIKHEEKKNTYNEMVEITAKGVDLSPFRRTFEEISLLDISAVRKSIIKYRKRSEIQSFIMLANFVYF